MEVRVRKHSFLLLNENQKGSSSPLFALFQKSRSKGVEYRKENGSERIELSRDGILFLQQNGSICIRQISNQFASSKLLYQLEGERKRVKMSVSEGGEML